MLASLRPRLTYANAIATVCLFVILGGSSIAAPVRDAAKKLVTGKHVKDNSLTTTDIRNGSLLLADFKKGQFPQAAAGPAGAQGPKGETGAPGRDGAGGRDGADGADGQDGANGATSVVVRKATGSVPGIDINGESGSLNLTSPCGPGERATGGSADAGSFARYVVWHRPAPNTNGSTPTGWEARFGNDSEGARPVSVYAVCAAP